MNKRKIAGMPLALMGAILGGVFGAARGAAAGYSLASNSDLSPDTQKARDKYNRGGYRHGGADGSGYRGPSVASRSGPRRARNVMKRIRQAMTLKRHIGGGVRVSRIASIKTTAV